MTGEGAWPELNVEPALSALRGTAEANRRLLAGVGSALAAYWAALTVVAIAEFAPWQSYRILFSSWIWLGEASLVGIGLITSVAFGLQRGRRGAELGARWARERPEDRFGRSLAFLTDSADWQQELDLSAAALYVATIVLPFLAVAAYLTSLSIGLSGPGPGVRAALGIVLGLGVPIGIGVFGVLETMEAAPRANRAARELSERRDSLSEAIVAVSGARADGAEETVSKPPTEPVRRAQVVESDRVPPTVTRVRGTLLGFSGVGLVVAGTLLVLTLSWIGPSLTRLNSAVLAIELAIFGVLLLLEVVALLVASFGVRMALDPRRRHDGEPPTTPGGPVGRALALLTLRGRQIDGAGEELRRARRCVLISGVLAAVIPNLLGFGRPLSFPGASVVIAFYFDLPYLAIPAAALGAIWLAWIGARLEAERRRFHAWLIRVSGIEAEFWSRYWN